MILQGQFRKTFQHPEQIVGCTKWCVFRKTDPTRAVVEAAVQERLDRMQSERVDLLQVRRYIESPCDVRLSNRDTDAPLAVPLAGLQ